jgi:hypothetical protein
MITAMCLQVDNGNVGDSIASLGGRGLFLKAFGSVILDSWYLKEPPLPYPGIPFIPMDYAMVLCTPWIWDQAYLSPKYLALKDFSECVRAGRYLALGAGSSYLLDYTGGKGAYYDEKTGVICAKYWEKFDHIICRDRLAQHIFSHMVGPDKVSLMPCPSFYIAQTFEIVATREQDHILAFCDVSEKTWKHVKPRIREAAMAYQDNLVRQGIDVLAMTPQDRDTFRERYGRQPTYIHFDPLDVVNCLARYRKATSARVHACMPSLSLGLDVDIIPIDSRSLTAHHLGAKVVGTELEQMAKFAEPIERISFDDACALLRRIATA